MTGAIGSFEKVDVKGQNETEEEERAGENPDFMDEPVLKWLLSRALHTCLRLSLLCFTLAVGLWCLSLTIIPAPHTYTLGG